MVLNRSDLSESFEAMRRYLWTPSRSSDIVIETFDDVIIDSLENRDGNSGHFKSRHKRSGVESAKLQAAIFTSLNKFLAEDSDLKVGGST